MTALLLFLLLLVPSTGYAGDTGIESDRLKTIQSLKKLDDFPLYVMRFYGDYDIPDLTSAEPIPPGVQCTCFSAKTEQGSHVLGRNFDWQNHPALLLYTDPPDRYASVSMVDISYLGYAKSSPVEQNPGGLLRSPFLPFDGMNERGLAVGMMAVPAAQALNDPQRATVSSLMIIRLILDQAKNLEEAAAIFKSFNIDFQGGPPLHYFVLERSGESAVIELADRDLSVLRNTHPWHVATNFHLTGRSLENSLASCWRYRRAWETLADQGPMSSSQDALSLLEDVAQPNTIWSVVYDTSTLEFLVVMGKKFHKVYEFDLKQGVWRP